MNKQTRIFIIGLIQSTLAVLCMSTCIREIKNDTFGGIEDWILLLASLYLGILGVIKITKTT